MKNKQSKLLFWTFTMICSIALIGFVSGSALADDVDSDGNPIVTPAEPEELSGGTVSTEEGEFPVEYDESFGSKTQATWIGAHEFRPYSSSEGWSSAIPHIYSFSGTGIFFAPVRLPSGALVTKVEYYYYDAYPSGNVRMQFWRANSQTSSSALFNYIPPFLWSPGYRTGAWTPGGGGLRIRNGQGWYYVGFDLASAAGNKHRLWGVRILWSRQVRTGLPNPFDDIGGLNSRFQNAIKAMAASGITKGCDSNSFCPGGFLTRGQMAVFLAEALGLHWDLSSGY